MTSVLDPALRRMSVWAVLILISNWRRNVMNTTLSGARGERGGERERKGRIERKVL